MIKIFFKGKVNSIINSETIIKNILCDHLQVDCNELNIIKTEYGKPYLESHPNIHFNISHTKDAIICTISDKPIGIDIEKIKSFNKRIAEKFFTKNEQDYIFFKEKDQNLRFYEIWTRKEAYVKWIGKGIEIPFDSFDVLRNIRVTTKYINDYVFSICSNNTSEINEINNINYYNCKMI